MQSEVMAILHRAVPRGKIEGIEIKKKIDSKFQCWEWKKNHDSKESTQESYMSDVG
jgi:hypothetical protein